MNAHRLATWLVGAFVLAGAFVAARPAAAAESALVGPGNVDVAAHWAARGTLANAVMFSGLGEPLELSMSRWDDILRHAGYTVRPRMPEMALVGAVHAGGEPRFAGAPDFARPETLRWGPAGFDRTLDPEAQAWTLAKITGPVFHLGFHERKADKHAALVMLPQAEAQARALAERLLNADGLFAPRRPDGAFGEATPRAQAAVLWAVSNLILAATSEREDYWHAAYRDLIDPGDWRGLAEKAVSAMEAVVSDAPGDRALAIEALGRYALAAGDATQRRYALMAARQHAEALEASSPAGIENAALAVYGLVEAGRLFAEAAYGEAAARLFEGRLLPLWDGELGAFRPPGGPVAYTARTAGAVAAALNAMRWYGPTHAAGEAARLFPAFFETVLVRAGLLLSSPLPLVPADYRKDRPDADFAHPALPSPGEAGVAPVFAAEVRHDGRRWSVIDPRFETAGAMFLANMLAMRRDGQADPFLPADRLAGLER